MARKIIPMWITQDETLSDLSMVQHDTKITNLRFVHVDFTNACLEQLKELAKREFETICLFSCRGQVDAAISFFLSSIKIQEFVVNTFVPDSFGDAAAMALGKGLEATTTLKRLHLHGCLVSRQFPDALRYGLKHCPSLEHIEFNLAHKLERSGNKIGRVMTEVLPTMPNLTRLEFRKNQIHERQLSALIEGLSKHPSLQEMDIAISCLDTTVVQELRKLAERNENNIEILNLFIEDHQFNLHKLSSQGSCSYCITPTMADPEDMQYLGKVAAKNPKITAVDLSFLKSKDDGIVKSFAPWIARMEGLRYLNMEGFRLHPSGGEALVMAMTANTSLEEVTLSSRCIFVSWMTHFCDWNKAGRHMFHAESIPDSLWSHVLHRAATATYKGGNESMDHESRRANVIFHLLRSQVGLWGSNM